MMAVERKGEQTHHLHYHWLESNLVIGTRRQYRVREQAWHVPESGSILVLHGLLGIDRYTLGCPQHGLDSGNPDITVPALDH